MTISQCLVFLKLTLREARFLVALSHIIKGFQYNKVFLKVLSQCCEGMEGTMISRRLRQSAAGLGRLISPSPPKRTRKSGMAKVPNARELTTTLNNYYSKVHPHTNYIHTRNKGPTKPSRIKCQWSSWNHFSAFVTTSVQMTLFVSKSDKS